MSVGKLLTVTTLACTCSLAFGSRPKIVSQTEKGVFTAIGKSFLFNDTITGTAESYIDVDLGSLRMDYSQSADAGMSYLLSGKLKRWYNYTTDNGRNLCNFFEFPSMPEPAQYFMCAENLLASGKKFFKDVYTIKDQVIVPKIFGPITFGGEEVADLHIDKDGGIRNVDFGGSLNILKVPFFFISGGFNATTTVLAKPDAAMFDVPTAWGECDKGKDPVSHMADFSKTEQAWMKCLLSASSHDTPDIVLV